MFCYLNKRSIVFSIFTLLLFVGLNGEMPKIGPVADKQASQQKPELTPEQAAFVKAFMANEYPKLKKKICVAEGKVVLDPEVQKVIDEYTDPAKIDQLMHMEKYREERQIAFNAERLCKFDIGFGAVDASVGIYKSDIGKLLFDSVDLWIEWMAYKCCDLLWMDLVYKEIMTHRQQYIDALTALVEQDGCLERGKPSKEAAAPLKKLISELSFKDFSKKLASENISLIVMHILLAYTSGNLRHYWMLDRSYGDSIIYASLRNIIGPGNQDQAEKTYWNSLVGSRSFSLYELIVEQYISSPKSLVLAFIRSILNDFRLIPRWTSGLLFQLSQHIGLTYLFMMWGFNHIMKPSLFDALACNRLAIIDYLKSIDESKKDSALSGHDIVWTVIKSAQKSTFLTWFSSKRKKYCLWRSWLEVAIMGVGLASGVKDLFWPANDQKQQ